MNKQEYKNYLQSKEWLLKKWELINLYRELGWEIKCMYCEETNNLEVNHLDYNHIGNELRRDGIDKGIDIYFTCRNCHKKYHFEKGFKENWLRNLIKNTKI